MCDNFRRNFVDKIVDALDNDVINKLRDNYGIIVKECYRSNYSRDKCGRDKCDEYCGNQCGVSGIDKCKKLYFNDDKYGDERGMQCNNCKVFLCSWCKSVKSDRMGLCIDCYFSKYDPKPMLLNERLDLCSYDPHCIVCDEKHKIYIMKTGKISWRIENTYCEQCYSLNSIVYKLHNTMIEIQNI